MSGVITPELTGSRCEIENDDCTEDFCENGGMCKDLLFDAECLCPTQDTYTGDRSLCFNQTFREYRRGDRSLALIRLSESIDVVTGHFASIRPRKFQRWNFLD